MSKTPLRPARLLVIGSILFILSTLLISACQGALLATPRSATATAKAALPPEATPAPLILEAPSPTPGSAVENSDVSENVSANPSISIWVNESSEAHEEMLSQMADEFTAVYQIDVELALVSPLLLPELVSTAALSGTLPDIIIHPLEYSLGWAERGILNTSAASTVVDQLGTDTFNSQALQLLNTPTGMAAVPSDGYAHLLVYREDWINDLGLPAPTNFSDMFNFAEATFDGETFLTAGFVIPTESNLVSTHQTFEQIARANGCELIALSGEVDFLSQPCLDALNFYFDIVHNFSPPGIQTVSSTRNAYLNGRTGMIMASPAVLPMIANLDPENPPICTECAENPSYLAENSRILTQISANSGDSPVSFGTITSLGITEVAQVETAVLFANYWFTEGYPQWLAINSERKVPMRLGTSDQPTQFIDSWGQNPLVENGPSLTELFGAETVNNMKTHASDFERWGFAKGQGLLVTQLYEDLTISIVLQEMLSGYFDSSQTRYEAYNRIVELIPNYQFPIIEPTNTPEG